MDRVLVLYATREGQTQKIAERIADHLTRAGVAADLVLAKDASSVKRIDLQAYDLLVFGASMHAGGLERELVRFVNDNARQIEARARSFFLVTLSAATKDPALKAESLADARRKMQAQLSVAFEDTEMIAGALIYSRYPLPLKWLMKRIAARAGEGTDMSRDYEYTDWQQVARYAERLIAIPH